MNKYFFAKILIIASLAFIFATSVSHAAKKHTKNKKISTVENADSASSSTPMSKNKVEYKYKDYEKFDFEDLVLEGETGSPGDLSIRPRYRPSFQNPLPYRQNFNPELRDAIERVR